MAAQNQTSQLYWLPLTEDKISGMMLMHALGDALGGPHEVYLSKAIYTGKLDYPIVRTSQHYGKRVSAIGQVTDDTEMSISLARSIIENGGYNREDVIKKYMTWASQPTTMLGHTTRALFAGIKTIKGYENRYKKGLEGTLRGLPKFKENVTLYDVQSNGTLMRAAPLAVLPGYDHVKIDTFLSNPNPVNLDINYLYVTALQQLSQMNVYTSQMTLSELYSFLVQTAQTDVSKKVFQDLNTGTIRDVSGKDKGWVGHAFYSAMYVLARLVTAFANSNRTNMPTYSELIGEVINMGGDTDTNGAIAGAIVGAYYGINHILATDPVTAENITIMLSVTTTHTAAEHVDPANPSKSYTGWTRGAAYTADNIPPIATALSNLY